LCPTDTNVLPFIEYKIKKYENVKSINNSKRVEVFWKFYYVPIENDKISIWWKLQVLNYDY